jgi:signal transduction histidine kinase/ActR/RegA family two-component response regulator
VSGNPLDRAAPLPPVVVHTPTGRDGALVAELLQANAIAVERTASGLDLARRLDRPTGAVVLAEEALDLDTARRLRDHLLAQPSWSDLPLIVLVAASHGARPPAAILEGLRETGSVTLLERPVQPVTLLTAVRTALRTRARQFQVQRYLDERARAEEEERRRQRIEAAGKLAGGVAHEVNNMMTAVLGFTDMALRHLEPGHPAAADLREVLKAGGRTARITQQLLAFTRQQLNKPETLSLSAVIHDLANLLQQSLGAEYVLHLDLPDELPMVVADRTQLEQVVINLLLNARDATPRGGTISVSVARADLDDTYRDRHRDVALQPGPYVQLAVSDTGHGMDPETMDRAFEPFFTTKPVGQGTGLGLSTVYGIVKQAGGYVWLYSESGHGTTVKIYLPAMGAAEPRISRSDVRLLHGDERILVVEDEEMVRRIACRALEEYGYRVLEAADGAAGLALLADGTEVDLILCDIVMPGLSGQELGAALARAAPGASILYMSGYTGSDVALRQLVLPSAPFIQKPFRAADLAAKVRALLDGRAAERRKDGATAGGADQVATPRG